MYQESKDHRYNRLVTKALRTSPFAFSIHENHYKKSYTYGFCEGSTYGAAAYVLQKTENGRLNDKLVIDITQDDNTVVTAAHHELMHIEQSVNANKKPNFTPFSFFSPAEDLAETLIWEAQAFAVQIEGPLIGFFNDLEKGAIQNIPFYEDHFANLKLVSNAGAKSHKYIEDFLQTTIPDGDLSETIDIAGHVFINSHMRRDTDERDAHLLEARKNLVKSFFEPVCNKNNLVLDGYINQSLSQHSTAVLKNKIRVEQFTGVVVPPDGQLPIFRDKTRVSLDEILDTTCINNQEYLPKKDWYDITKARDVNNFVRPHLSLSQNSKIIERLNRFDSLTNSKPTV